MRSSVVLTVVSLLLSIVALVPYPAKPSIEFSSSGNGTQIAIQQYSGPLLTVSSEHAPSIRTFWIYTDNRYAYGRGVSAPFAYGLGLHLAADFRARSMGTRIVTVDAQQLKAVLTSTPRGSALVVTGGILPDTVRNSAMDLLKGWIARGGVVFWEGEPFDLVFSSRGSGDAPPVVSARDASKWPEFYQTGVFNPDWDPFSQPLTIGYRPAAFSRIGYLLLPNTTYAPFSDDLERVGGAAIGYIDDYDRSSVSVIPYKSGRIVYFADGYTYEVFLARDIAQILWTGEWYAPRTTTSKYIIVDAGERLALPVQAGRQAFAFAENTNDFPLGSDAW